jgi:putative transposase
MATPATVIDFPRREVLNPERSTNEQWNRLPAKKRTVAIQRQRLCEEALRLQRDEGLSTKAASAALVDAIVAERVSRQIRDVASELAKRGRIAPSAKSIESWLHTYNKVGAIGLVPGHKGSDRRTWGWEGRFHYYYDRPTKPTFAAVAEWLQDDGWTSATYDRVRRYALSLPQQQGKNSPKRVGRHYYNQNLRPYKMRDETVLPVGFIYEGDGHTCDVYVAHPNTGKPWRPEFTPWVDVRSHYIVGWYLSEAESGITTLFSLSKSIVHHDHVPAYIHVDPGSGFKNRLISSDEVNSFCARMSIEFMAALPGNAKGKGLTEGLFKHFEEKVGKRFETYCGHERTDDFLRHLSAKVERGEIVLPSLDEYVAAIAAWVERYNNRAQKRLGCAPAELWAQLERTPVELPGQAIIRPSESRTVRRWRVQLHGRTYEHAELAAYNGRQVNVEYDLHDDRVVWIRDMAGRFICEAGIVERVPWMPVSRIEEGKRKRLKGQLARKQRAIDEDRERARLSVTHDQALRGLEEFESPALADDSNKKGFEHGPNPFHSPDQVPDSGKDDWDWSDYI